MDSKKLLQGMTVNPRICGGKAMMLGRRLAAEHVLSKLAAGTRLSPFWKAILGWNGKTSVLPGIRLAAGRTRTGGTDFQRDRFMRILLDICDWGAVRRPAHPAGVRY
jgi:hypothetical protein